MMRDYPIEPFFLWPEQMRGDVKRVRRYFEQIAIGALLCVVIAAVMLALNLIFSGAGWFSLILGFFLGVFCGMGVVAIKAYDDCTAILAGNVWHPRQEVDYSG